MTVHQMLWKQVVGCQSLKGILQRKRVLKHYENRSEHVLGALEGTHQEMVQDCLRDRAHLGETICEVVGTSLDYVMIWLQEL